MKKHRQGCAECAWTMNWNCPALYFTGRECAAFHPRKGVEHAPKLSGIRHTFKETMDLARQDE